MKQTLIQKQQSPWHMPKIMKPSQVLKMVEQNKLCTQIKGRFFDKSGGKCTIGVLIDYFGGNDGIDQEAGIFNSTQYSAWGTIPDRIGLSQKLLAILADRNDNYNVSFYLQAEYLEELGY